MRGHCGRSQIACNLMWFCALDKPIQITSAFCLGTKIRGE